MTSKLFLSALLFSIASTLVSAFDPNSNQNVVLYWGQNSASTQQRLSYYCENDVADILVLSFMSSFPGTDNKPSLNFANACWDTKNGVLHCTNIAEDIKTCQDKGKIVLLSMGGAVGSYGFSSADEAENFAGTVWDMFGEGNGEIRPFDDSLIDGFDLDLENKKPDYYSNFVTKLREYYATGSKSYYVSAAPQCVLPDASVNEAMINSDIDFAFIQFYNNYCKLGSEFNYNDWVNWAAQDSYNKNIKLYVGLPGSSAAAGSGYASPDTVKTYVDDISCGSNFGGISIWDASQAYSNTENGKNFAESAKEILESQSCSGTSSIAKSSSATTQSTSTVAKSSSATKQSTSTVAQSTSTSAQLTSTTASSTFLTALISDSTTFEINSSETSSSNVPETAIGDISVDETTESSASITINSSLSSSKVTETTSSTVIVSSSSQVSTDLSNELQTNSETFFVSTETLEKTTITLQPTSATGEADSQDSSIPENVSVDKEITSDNTSSETTSAEISEETDRLETSSLVSNEITTTTDSISADNVETTSQVISTDISGTIEITITTVSYDVSTTVQLGEIQTFTITEEEIITTYTTIYYDIESISVTNTDGMSFLSVTESPTASMTLTAVYDLSSTAKETETTTVSDVSSENDDTEESCTDGSWQCGHNGTIQHCNFGKWVSFECASGTSCSKYNFNGVDIVGCIIA